MLRSSTSGAGKEKAVVRAALRTRRVDTAYEYSLALFSSTLLLHVLHSLYLSSLDPA